MQLQMDGYTYASQGKGAKKNFGAFGPKLFYGLPGSHPDNHPASFCRPPPASGGWEVSKTKTNYTIEIENTINKNQLPIL